MEDTVRQRPISTKHDAVHKHGHREKKKKIGHARVTLGEMAARKPAANPPLSGTPTLPWVLWVAVYLFVQLSACILEELEM